MACCPTEQTYGYEVSRFEKDVDENFHCSICYNVLKEPRTCRNNDHIFCLVCISQHLKVNSQTCPECNEHLSVDTLRRPRVLIKILSKLKINCDYASRGCPEFTCLQGLKTHVANCGFAPVLCLNEGCGIAINKQDKVHHETEVCEYRRVKCRDCGQIQGTVERLEGSLAALDGKVEAAVRKIDRNINQSMEVVKEMNENGQTKQKLGEVKKEVKDLNDNLSKVNKDVDEVKVMITQVLEKLNMLQLLDKLSSPAEKIPLNTPREDILIAGGSGLCTSERSTEIYSWEKNGWFVVASMNEERVGASSFIDNDEVFVVGGYDSKTIESLEINTLPLKWTRYSGKLPYACGGHQTVVCQQSVIHIGGYNYDEDEWSDFISELQLTSSCAMIELCQMPEPRGCYAAEVVEDKVLILGGLNSDIETMDSVWEFDPTTKKCREIQKLPFVLSGMATVRWRDEVVVLGGEDKDSQVRNDVFMYNSKTGKVTVLPSMLEKRYACCAVITGNTIVVMGGWNDKSKIVGSVECFVMGRSAWEYLSAMNDTRSGAVAEVLPRRKYV